eukprot:5857653-Amphidinium_carterae.1
MNNSNCTACPAGWYSDGGYVEACHLTLAVAISNLRTPVANATGDALGMTAFWVDLPAVHAEQLYEGYSLVYKVGKTQATTRELTLHRPMRAWLKPQLVMVYGRGSPRHIGH